MTSGWDTSASAWIAAMGERGDFAREHVLDPAMQERVLARPHHVALDVGCGEGRFCRWLRSRDLRVTGIDPTERLVAEARLRDRNGDYRIARAESLRLRNAALIWS